MKKLTKAMAISLLASTVAISTVGCRYTVEVKDNEAPTKQEQQVQPTVDEKSDSTTDNSKEAEKTTKEAQKTEKSANTEKTTKKAEKSSSHTTAKGESKKEVKVYIKEKEKDHRHICTFCGKRIPYDDAIYSEAGWAHGKCLNNFFKENNSGDWDDSPTEPEPKDEPDNAYDDAYAPDGTQHISHHNPNGYESSDDAE